MNNDEFTKQMEEENLHIAKVQAAYLRADVLILRGSTIYGNRPLPSTAKEVVKYYSADRQIVLKQAIHYLYHYIISTKTITIIHIGKDYNIFVNDNGDEKFYFRTFRPLDDLYNIIDKIVQTKAKKDSLLNINHEDIIISHLAKAVIMSGWKIKYVKLPENDFDTFDPEYKPSLPTEDFV